jgi:hypothetical protein
LFVSSVPSAWLINPTALSTRPGEAAATAAPAISRKPASGNQINRFIGRTSSYRMHGPGQALGSPSRTDARIRCWRISVLWLEVGCEIGAQRTAP